MQRGVCEIAKLNRWHQFGAHNYCINTVINSILSWKKDIALENKGKQQLHFKMVGQNQQQQRGNEDRFPK